MTTTIHPTSSNASSAARLSGDLPAAPATNGLPDVGSVELQVSMVVSTGHVTRDESHLLDAGGGPGYPVVCMTGDQGWLLYVGDLHGFDTAKLSDGFRGVVEAAVAIGVAYIRFDSDGPVLEGVPTYSW